MLRRLLEPVWRDLEHEPTDERGAPAHAFELAEPEERKQAGGEQAEQDEDVPADDDAERALERPERQPEWPRGRV